MKCPNCNSEIIDSAIICPVCNTQFAFSAPSTFNPNQTNIYEEVETLDDEVNVPSPATLPTEVDHGGEEEVNPSDFGYAVKEEPEECMRINGQPIKNDDSPYNPMDTFAQRPIMVETPRVTSNVAAPTKEENVPVISYAPTTDMVKKDGKQEDVKQEVVKLEKVEEKPVVTSVTETVGTINEEETKRIKNDKKKSDMFFVTVIGLGLIVLAVLVGVIFFGDDIKKDKTPPKYPTTTTTSVPSDNIGYRSTFNYPMNVGNTTLASIYDKDKKISTNVDVTGIRFIKGVEAEELAKAYATENLNEGFEWLGFEYKVTLNDLKYLKDKTINPVLKSKIYKWDGCDFINFNGKNYFLNMVSIYKGNEIKNKESATIKVIYQLPVGQESYSVCFGDIEETLGCFSENIGEE